MKDIFGREQVKLQSGEPCIHKGCTKHTTKPCEVCNRISMQGEVEVLMENVPPKHFEKT